MIATTEGAKLSGAAGQRLQMDRTLENPVKSGAEGAKLKANLSGKRTKF